jgi:hypothetical protein
MRLLAVLALSLLCMSGTAAASFTITVPDQKQHSYSQFGQTDQDYTFQLTNPPFNLTGTGGNYTNESIYTAQVATAILNERGITESTRYAIQYVYNNSDTYRAEFYYEKHGWGFFSYWNMYSSLQRNDVEVCSDARTGQFASSSISPNPRFSFDFSLRGSYNGVRSFNPLNPLGIGKQGEINSANISGEVIYNNPSLFLEFRDQLTYATDYVSFFGVSGNAVRCANVPDVATFSGAVFDSSVFEITSAPAVVVSTSDSQGSYTHEIKYEFANATVTVSRTADIITDIDKAQDECILGFGGGLCLESLFAGFIEKIFGLAFKPIDWLLSFTPWYSTIRSAAAYIFDTIASFYNTILVISMEGGASDTNFPVGGIGIAIIVWSFSLGFLLWGFTGNPAHIIGIPYWLVIVFIWSIVILTYGLWIWLPMKGIQLVTAIIQNIRG